MTKLYNEIFCDYDGVLVDFKKGVLKTCGKEYMDPYYGTPEGEKVRAELLAAAGPEFWADLEPMPDYEELWSYLQPLDPYILTAYASWCEVNRENSIIGKMDWNKKHTKVSWGNLCIVRRSDKQKFAHTHGIPNILIDDFKNNIKEWEKAGGIGIYHKTAKQTIERLNELRSNNS